MIVSDGGCTMPCDVAKAFGGGAISLVFGRMLAGHEESGGGQRGRRERREIYAVLRHEFESAMNRHVGGVAKYRAAEGKTAKFAAAWPVGNTARYPRVYAQPALASARLSPGKELTKRTTFIRVQ